MSPGEEEADALVTAALEGRVELPVAFEVNGWGKFRVWAFIDACKRRGVEIPYRTYITTAKRATP